MHEVRPRVVRGLTTIWSMSKREGREATKLTRSVASGDLGQRKGPAAARRDEEVLAMSRTQDDVEPTVHCAPPETLPVGVLAVHRSADAVKGVARRGVREEVDTGCRPLPIPSAAGREL